MPIPLAAFARWFDRTGAPELGSFLKSTATVPGVVRSEPPMGVWRDPGDRRKLIFVDGASVLEQILDKGPRNMRVEMWDLENKTGRYIAYAVENFALSETPTGTRVTWITDFEPKVQPPDGWMIRSYVGEDYRDFMQRGLNAMALRAISDLGLR
ncbi:SRPBCC family protein [Beijerinckia sp. L45]|uniref:SRPBCC family protein n=1 Tax=Beijerinckia sp. L45 TaxID=1641855 RepID=UPI00131CADC7|nr:SRPBCC family protein [Beijerinckia sp. L45]